MIGYLIGVLLWIGGLFAAPAWGATEYEMEPEANPCPLMAGPHEILFSGYTVAMPRQQFCQEITETGGAFLTLDAISRELRDMMMDIQIVRDTVTLAHLPAQKYPTGTVTFPVVFDKPGTYFVLVTVTGEHGWIDKARFPLSVGETGNKAYFVYILLGLAVVGLAFYIANRRRGDPESPPF